MVRPPFARPPHHKLAAVALACAAMAGGVGCEELPGGSDMPLIKRRRNPQIRELAKGRSCSTAAAKALSLQVVRVMNCVDPTALVKVPRRRNLKLGPATLAYLEQPAQKALLRALKAHPERTLKVNSMLRTVVAQHLLRRWYEEGACGITAAARPGGSNHESGLALDISQPRRWRKALEKEGFRWLGAWDAPHFDYKGKGAKDLRQRGVAAFQLLWTYNHPKDGILADGHYGPATAKRLEGSPAGGFSKVPSCGWAMSHLRKDEKLLAERRKGKGKDSKQPKGKRSRKRRKKLASRESEGRVDSFAVSKERAAAKGLRSGCQVDGVGRGGSSGGLWLAALLGAAVAGIRRRSS